MSALVRSSCFVLVLGAVIAVPVEWKGVFYTPDSGATKKYKWSAEKVYDASLGSTKYADASMKIALIPAPNATAALASWTTALADATPHGVAALADNNTCEEVVHGATLTPSTTKCYKLKFKQDAAISEYLIDASSTQGIAFFCEHVPTEFEADQHYLKDHSGADVEPLAQDPAPGGSGHGHSHGGGGTADPYMGKCVCQAKANGWTLDCSTAKTGTALTAAVNRVKTTPACKLKRTKTKQCVDDFANWQAHHDHCLHHDLPTDIEKKFHDYEKAYDDCFIKRQYNPALGACPAVACTNQGAMTLAENAIKLAGNGCLTNCSKPACGDAIKTILMAHDTCTETQLTDSLETTLHDYEDSCSAQLCNTAGGAFDPFADSCSASVSGLARSVHDSRLATAWILPLTLLISLYSRHP